jgi:hypothetical protein
MPAPSRSIPRTALLLGVASLIPLFVAALSVWFSLPLSTTETGLDLVVVYAAILLSFLGGIRWGAAVGPYDGRRQDMEFALSALGPLVGLAAVLLPSLAGLTLLIGGFLLQALWDVTSAEAGRLPLWFGRLRMLVTVGVVVALVATLVAVVT